MLRYTPVVLVLTWTAALTACGGDEPDESAECGNAVIEGDELCDDGNLASGDGCTVLCTLESGWTCAIEGIPCTTRCGDTITAGTETCDDGNTDDGDGCSSTCSEEAPPPAEVCDDGVDNDEDEAIDCEDSDCASACSADEDCDDGLDNDRNDLTDCDDPACATATNCVSVDENCAEPGDEDGNGDADCDDAACTCTCGDGTLNGSEQCDEGAANSDTEPNACRTSCSLASCGDGVVDSGELCDGGEPPTGFICEACLLVPVPVCGESASLSSWRISTSTTEGLQQRYVLDSSRADDVAVPAGCLPAQGSDAIVPVSFVEGGVYRFTFTTPDPGTRVAALFSNSCDFSTATCERASTGLEGTLVVSASGEDTAYLALDSGTQARVTVDITVERFERALNEGDACDPVSVTDVCAAGLTCTVNPGGNATCSRARTLSGLGGPCVLGTDCIAGLECNAGTCNEFAGTTCATALDLADIATDEPTTISVLPSLGAVAGTCGGYPQTSVYRVDADGFYTIRASSALGLPVALSAREVCALSISEQACAADSSGVDATLSFEVPNDASRTVVVESFGDVTLEVQQVPLRDAGQRCDVAGVSDRCASTLSCVSGTCVAALAGSCADPAPAFLAGSGDLTGRGLIVPFTPSTVTGNTIPGCTGSVRTQVFALTVPETGRMVAGVLLETPGITVRLTQTCAAETGTETFCNPERGSSDVLNVRAGQNVQLMISSSSSDEALINVQLQPTSPEFGPCADTNGCEPGLECSGGTCARRAVALDAPCSLVTDRCPSNAVCAPDGTQLRCLANPGGEGQICNTLAGLPTCSGALVCEEGDGPTPVCGESGAGLGESCTADSDCEGRFVCLSRTCFPAPGAEGAECNRTSPQPCQTGLACVPSGLISICVDATPVSCTSDRDCTSPSVCFAETCQAPLSIGQPCGRETLPCGAGLTCGASNSCERRRADVDEFCASNSDCNSGLFCRIFPGASDGFCAAPRAEGEICVLGADPLQCVAPLVCVSDASSIPRCSATP